MSISGASASCTMKILSPGMDADRVGVDLARQRVEAVEDQADVGVIGAAHDLPGVAMVVDVPAPGQRLVADAHAGARARARPVRGSRRRRGRCRPAQRARRWSRPASGRCRAPASARTCAGRGRRRGSRCGSGRPSKSRNGWNSVISRPRSRAMRPTSRGARAEGQEVVLEDLDAVEAGRRDGLELFAEIAADRDGRDRGLHPRPPTNELVRT